MTLRRIGACAVVVAALWSAPVHAQSRGVYPLGMSAVNSGVTAEPGFSYSNQLLFYSRDTAKDDDGATLPVTGHNAVLMDLNSFAWVSQTEILGGARYSAAVTLPVARNALESDVHDTISGGGGFADSYFLPIILGWNKERVSFRVLFGFLAPTGRFEAGGTDNVGSGYWTFTLSSGQTFSLTNDKLLALSVYEMYEVHTTQEGTATHPGDTFDLDYSVMRTFPLASGSWRLQVGVAGYEQRQTTAKTGPSITPAQSLERYAVNAAGLGLNASFPRHNLSLSARFFKEFDNRATFEGYSLQFSGAIRF